MFYENAFIKSEQKRFFFRLHANTFRVEFEIVSKNECIRECRTFKIYKWNCAQCNTNKINRRARSTVSFQAGNVVSTSYLPSFYIARSENVKFQNDKQVMHKLAIIEYLRIINIYFSFKSEN